MKKKFGPNYKVPFRRRREVKTNYRYRLRLLKSKLPRAVVRKSLKQTQVQFIEYSIKGDLVKASAISGELKKFGWQGSTSNLPAAYLTGLLAGKRAIEQNIETAVLDIGLNAPVKGSKVFASLSGIIDSGVEVPHGDDIIPKEERITGSHISESVPKDFEKTKNNIMGKIKTDSEKKK